MNNAHHFPPYHIGSSLGIAKVSRELSFSTKNFGEKRKYFEKKRAVFIDKLFVK